MTEWCDRRVWYSAVTIGSVKLRHVYCVWNNMFVCFCGFSKSSVGLLHGYRVGCSRWWLQLLCISMI